MPRPFNETERHAVRDRLLDAARRHFTHRGYRRAAVADIARDAGIGKGSVYLFFASKAALFMAVAEMVEAEIRAAYLAETRRTPEADVRRRIEHLLTFHVDALDREPLLRVLLDPTDMARLFRDAPRSLAAAHQQGDAVFFEQLLKGWAEEGMTMSIDPEMLASVLRALYVIVLHKDLVGGDKVGDILDLLVGAAGALAEP